MGRYALGWTPGMSSCTDLTYSFLETGGKDSGLADALLIRRTAVAAAVAVTGCSRARSAGKVARARAPAAVAGGGGAGVVGGGAGKGVMVGVVCHHLVGDCEWGACASLFWGGHYVATGCGENGLTTWYYIEQANRWVRSLCIRV